MKKLSVLIASLSLAALVAPSTVFAAKADGPKAKAMQKYDTNKNGKLDADEIAAIRKDFAATPEGDLKRFDADKDGKLSDEEVAKIVPGSGTKAGGGKKADTEKKADEKKAGDTKKN
jgi:Ca2+-binding EF-hand superfamily protein